MKLKCELNVAMNSSDLLLTEIDESVLLGSVLMTGLISYKIHLKKLYVFQKFVITFYFNIKGHTHYTHLIFKLICISVFPLFLNAKLLKAEFQMSCRCICQYELCRCDRRTMMYNVYRRYIK